jgi:hypothetical protein
VLDPLKQLYIQFKILITYSNITNENRKYIIGGSDLQPETVIGYQWKNIINIYDFNDKKWYEIPRMSIVPDTRTPSLICTGSINELKGEIKFKLKTTRVETEKGKRDKRFEMRGVICETINKQTLNSIANELRLSIKEKNNFIYKIVTERLYSATSESRCVNKSS